MGLGKGKKVVLVIKYVCALAEATNPACDPMNKLLFDLYSGPCATQLSYKLALCRARLMNSQIIGLLCHLHLLIKCQQLKAAGSITTDTRRNESQAINAKETFSFELN